MSKSLVRRRLTSRVFSYVEVRWEPRDLWIGYYYSGSGDYYLCLVPCLPIHWRLTKVKGTPEHRN
jgi:hypothetical protein